MVKKQVTEEMLKRVETALKETRSARKYKRLQVIQLRGRGKSYAEIAEVTGYTREWAGKLVSEYINAGHEEYVREKHTSHHRNMSEAEEAAFLSEFAAQSSAGKMVDLQEMKAAYAERTGKPCANSTLYHMLQRNGWRKVMPRSKHPKKANEEAMDATKKLIDATKNWWMSMPKEAELSD